MKLIIRSLSLTALVALAQPAAAQCTLPPPPPAPEPSASLIDRTAYELATVYVPESTMISMIERVVNEGLRGDISRDERARDLLSANPPLYNILLNSRVETYRACLATIMPTMRATAAATFGAGASVAHMREITAFYRSSAGQAILRAIGRTFQPRPLVFNPDGSLVPVTPADIAAANASAFEAVNRSMTQQEINAVNQFGRSPAGQTFVSLQGQLQGAILADMNALLPSIMAQMQAADIAAVEEYFRANPQARPVN